MNQQQSRRTLIGVGVLALMLLASPFVLQSWTSHRELSGKVLIWEGQSAARSNALLRCLVQRPAGGMVLSISRENEFYDARRDLAVRVERTGSAYRLRAWATPGTALTDCETAQLNACLTPPPVAD